MTIKDNRNKTTTFDSLCYGTTFIYNKSVYLTIPAVKYDGITKNACNLTLEGLLAFFDGDVLVEPVEIEIVIN